MVKFLSLRVNDLFSYGEADIQFKPGIFLFEGRNLDRDGCSNMAGKSALWDALATVLWEENSRGQIKDDVVNRLRKKGEGVVVFDNELSQVAVRYARGEEKNWSVKVDGKVEEYNWDTMRRRVRDLVGMSYEEFTLSSWFQQGMMDSFLTKNDAEKKELFIKWLGLDIFQKMREKVKDRRREVEAEIKVRKDAQVLLEKLKEIEVKDEELSKALQVLEKWKNVMPLSVEEYRGKRRVVLEQLRRWRDAKRVEGLVQELRKIRDDLSGRMSNISEKLKYLKDGRCWVCGSEVDTQALLQRANTDISHISSTLSQVEEQLRTLELVYVKGKGVDRDGLIRDIGEVRKRLGDVDEYKKAIEIKAKADEQERRRTALQEVDLSVLKELEWELETARKWEKGLGDDGVVAYILQKVLAVFNAMMKKYGEVLGIDVSFRIGSKGQLEIDVSDGFKSMGKLNWWSGSERYAIMLVVMLGLSEFLAYQGKGTNLLILDEVFAPFDEVWRERLVELLKWLQAGDKTVVVITHHDDVKKAVDWSGVWVVEKRNGVSTLISNA